MGPIRNEIHSTESVTLVFETISSLALKKWWEKHWQFGCEGQAIDNLQSL